MFLFTKMVSTEKQRALHQVQSKLKHFFLSKYWRGHRVHSPFSYDLIRHVITTRQKDIALRTRLRNYRQRLLESNETIFVEDFGTGQSSSRRIANIARAAAITEKYGLLLSRLVKHYKPNTVIEIGTSLGISTVYMASACADTRVITIEGSEQLANLARRNFKAEGLENVEVLCGRFDDVLPQLIDNYGVSLVFVDGNHTREATLRYFECCCAKAQHGSIVVFDDIYWSKEMTDAWQQICADPRVQVTIDIFRQGIVCFRSNCPKQHYRLRW